METVKDRLNKVYKELVHKGVIAKKEDLAPLLGFSIPYTSQVFFGDREISAKFSERIFNKTGISKDWIMTGLGEMMPGQPADKGSTDADKDNKIARFQQLKEANAPLTEGEIIRRRKAFGDKERQGIIYVPIPAQAGYAKNFLDPVYMSDLGRWRIEGLPYEGERFRVFQVKGSSMEYIDEVTGKPDGFFEGMDVVAEIVEPEDWKKGQIPPYHVYVIVTEDEILIKRILIKDNGDYVMHSDNPDEKPRQKLLPKESIKELWYCKRKLDWGMAPPSRIDIEI